MAIEVRVAFLPQGKFTPVLLLAEMPTVVSPPDDDGFILARTGVEPIEQTAHLIVEIRNGRQIGLHALFPLVALQNGFA
jgi:hypothetical protein